MQKIIAVCCDDYGLKSDVIEALQVDLNESFWPNTFRVVGTNNHGLGLLLQCLAVEGQKADTIVVIPETSEHIEKALDVAHKESPAIPAIVWTEGRFKTFIEAKRGVFVLKMLPKPGPRLISKIGEVSGGIPPHISTALASSPPAHVQVRA